MNEKTTETMLFRMPRERSTASEVLISVYESMREKGYDPINQIVGSYFRRPDIYNQL